MPRMCQAMLFLVAVVLVTATTQEDSTKPQEASRPCTSPRIFEPGCVAANTSRSSPVTVPPAAELAIKAALKNGTRGPSLMQLEDAKVTGFLSFGGGGPNFFDPFNGIVPPGFGNSGNPGSHQDVLISNKQVEFAIGQDFSYLSTCDITSSGLVTWTDTIFGGIAGFSSGEITLVSRAFLQFHSVTPITDTYKDYQGSLGPGQASLEGDTLTIIIPEVSYTGPITLTFSIQLVPKTQCTPGSDNLCCSQDGQFLGKDVVCRPKDPKLPCDDDVKCPGDSGECLEDGFATDGDQCRVPYNFHQHHMAAQTASTTTNTKPAPGSTEQPRADLAYHGYHHKDKALPLCDGTCQGGDCKVTYEAFMECSPRYY